MSDQHQSHKGPEGHTTPDSEKSQDFPDPLSFLNDLDADPYLTHFSQDDPIHGTASILSLEDVANLHTQSDQSSNPTLEQGIVPENPGSNNRIERPFSGAALFGHPSLNSYGTTIPPPTHSMPLPPPRQPPPPRPQKPRPREFLEHELRLLHAFYLLVNRFGTLAPTNAELTRWWSSEGENERLYNQWREYRNARETAAELQARTVADSNQRTALEQYRGAVATYQRVETKKDRYDPRQVAKSQQTLDSWGTSKNEQRVSWRINGLENKDKDDVAKIQPWLRKQQKKKQEERERKGELGNKRKRGQETEGRGEEEDWEEDWDSNEEDDE